jgi:hypothetical protein
MYPQWIRKYSNRLVIAGYDHYLDGDQGIMAWWLWVNNKRGYITESNDSIFNNPWKSLRMEGGLGMGQKGFFATGISNDTYVPYIYENGAVRYWTDPEGLLNNSGPLGGVCVLYNHVFIGGAYTTDDGTIQNCYWRNNKRHDLAYPGPNRYIRDICAVERSGPSPVKRFIPSNRAFTSLDQSKTWFRILPVSSESLRVQYCLTKSSPVTLEIVDVTGRMVFRTSLGPSQPGISNVTVSIKPRISGLYTARLKYSGGRMVRSLVLAK